MKTWQVLALVGTLACTGPAAMDPNANPKATADAAGDATLGQGPKKVDFLLVMDNSPGSCQEQREIAKEFPAFAQKLLAAGYDLRVAVTSHQQLPDAGLQLVIQPGRFNRSAAKTFPPNCIEKTVMPCLKDGDCTQPVPFTFPANHDPSSSLCPLSGTVTPTALPPADWRCKTTSHPTYAANDNCTLNSYCWAHCTTDAHCQALFPDLAGVYCYSPGGDPTFAQAGCMAPPATQDCPPPEQLPAVLDLAAPKDPQHPELGSQLDWFRCLSTFGASQTQESKFEGGLRAAWQALDPNGPNCPKDEAGRPKSTCQHQQLLRPDALLVVLFWSDDEDCSVHPDEPMPYATSADKEALKTWFSKEEWERCEALGDWDASNEALSEGNCEVKKVQKKLDLCPSDCRKLQGQAAAACTAKVEATRATWEVRDKGPGGKLRLPPASVWVQKFKTLKAKPEQILPAVFMGESLAATPEQRYADRVSYYRSLLRNQSIGQGPYLCMGPLGYNVPGVKYEQFVDAFGGVKGNLCEGFPQAFEQLRLAVAARLAGP